MPTVDGDDYTYDKHLNALIAPYLHRDDARDLRTSDQRVADELAALRAAFDRMAVELAQLRRLAERAAYYEAGS